MLLPGILKKYLKYLKLLIEKAENSKTSFFSFPTHPLNNSNSWTVSSVFEGHKILFIGLEMGLNGVSAGLQANFKNPIISTSILYIFK